MDKWFVETCWQGLEKILGEFKTEKEAIEFINSVSAEKNGGFYCKDKNGIDWQLFLWSEKQELLNSKSNGICVKGHLGTWYVIDVNTVDFGKPIFLLEHEEYGDEAGSVIVDEYGVLLLDDVWNGFSDYAEAFGYDFC